MESGQDTSINPQRPDQLDLQAPDRVRDGCVAQRSKWARGKQRPANAERALFKNSLTDEDRRQIEERIQQLLDDNPPLSPTNARALDSKTEPPCVSLEVLDEYYSLRDIVG